ncbi:MAG: O-methyltransferase [Elusimicrobia bacterium]|nr:O-methyltransferase [Elusimicrobiota bacterium]
MMNSHNTVLRKQYLTRDLLNFVQRLMATEDAALKWVLRQMKLQGLPMIQIGPIEGKILNFLVKACGARKAVEIGTLAGYSSIWIARGLASGGRLYTLESDPRHAALARRGFKKAGLSRTVRVIEGNARDSLRALSARGPFDFCFIDADKVSYPVYLRWAAANLRPGAIIAGDNAYLFGKLHKKPSRPARGNSLGDEIDAAPAMREFLRLMCRKDLFSSCCMIPTGEGMAVAVKK